MPDGHIHARATAIVAIAAPLILYRAGVANTAHAAYVSAGALTGILVSPDLDLMENGNLSLAIIRKRSHFLAWLWKIFWYPYARVHHHRGMSHWPIIGTVVRVLYLAFPFTIILVLFRIRVPPLPWFFPAFAGLCLVDIVHIFLDAVVKGKHDSRSQTA